MTDDDSAKGRRKAPLDPRIESNLKRVYEEAAGEEMPERLTALLDRLRSGRDDTEPESGDVREEDR